MMVLNFSSAAQVYGKHFNKVSPCCEEEDEDEDEDEEDEIQVEDEDGGEDERDVPCRDPSKRREIVPC